MNYAFQKNQIYSCSWGPPDDGQAMDAPGILIKRAMVNGVQNGRGGKGSIYVFASGNGAGRGDNCNFDGYTNSIYSITIGAIDRKGLSPYYSERCCAQMVVTYSSGSGDAIVSIPLTLPVIYSVAGLTDSSTQRTLAKTHAPRRTVGHPPRPHLQRAFLLLFYLFDLTCHGEISNISRSKLPSQ